MIDTRERLTILHDDNSVFADYTEELSDFTVDAATIELISADDFLYIGYFKPINAVYCAFTTANTNANSITVETYNGTSWVAVTDLIDKTKGFTQDGFIQWARYRSSDDIGAVDVNGKTQYWFRIKPDSDHSSTVIKGINILLNDDNDIRKKNPNVLSANYYPTGESSHLIYNVAARDEIIQMLRNSKRITKVRESDFANNESTLRTLAKQVTAFDLLDYAELRNAASYLALHYIFFDLSDRPEDVYAGKAAMYKKKSDNNFAEGLLNFDSDDDGIKDFTDQQIVSAIRITKG